MTSSNTDGPQTLKKGDMVLVQLPFDVKVAKVTSVDSNGVSADIQIYTQTGSDTYEIDRKAKETFERVKKMIPVKFTPIESSAAVVRIRTDDLEAAKLILKTRGGVSRGEQNEQLKFAVTQTTGGGMMTPTRSQALFGAALSIPLAAYFYATYNSINMAYLSNDLANSDAAASLSAQEISSRQLFLSLWLGSSVLTLFAGASLLVWAWLRGSDETKQKD
eukprot:CAMPEP_0184698548 /NCGR_PEP_ID=MMETSP0313-20130426/5139_1 /TAXON_ID=2792 /ORGANISM="Porphyridium aerugineum, Strain SAG 1380-2" /LENGTH=218 /DNA_ID=CAMNT_0027157511 /DNA_START=362 /DNA_END=1018 /DNA_ORIENTATION=-